MVSSAIGKAGGSSNYFGNGGSGQYAPLRRGGGGNKQIGNPFGGGGPLIQEIDPVYMVFGHLDKQPVSKLASDFVKENIEYPIIQFLTTVTNKLNKN